MVNHGLCCGRDTHVPVRHGIEVPNFSKMIGDLRGRLLTQGLTKRILHERPSKGTWPISVGRILYHSTLSHKVYVFKKQYVKATHQGQASDGSDVC